MWRLLVRVQLEQFYKDGDNMAAIEQKMRQDKLMQERLDMDLEKKRKAKRDKKLENDIIYYLTQQVSERCAMAILNKARVHIKLRMGSDDNG